jgi:nitrogen fixation/metabolism regulation signal transduction histidine kinase
MTDSRSPETAEAVAAPRFSIAGKLALLLALSLVLFASLAWGIRRLPWLEGQPLPLLLPEWVAYLTALSLTLPVVVWIAVALLRPLVDTVRDLADGIRSFHDHDFSMRIATERNDELGELIRLYNTISATLQEERTQIRQRELLLQSALDQSPLAIVLVNPLDRVVYANHEARRLFLGGSRLQGLRFQEVLDNCPGEMRDVLDTENDGIFTVDGKSERETYHLAQRTFFLNHRRHVLYLLRRMTAELGRQEAEIWKRVIRIISHELNNSLAPISSLAHSGRLIARDPEQLHRLEPLYASIRERVDYLTNFLEGYARFARLPKPRKQKVVWGEWLEGPRKLYRFETLSDPPAQPGWFDPSQLQQGLINLLKNSYEASDGEPEVRVRVDRLPDGDTRVQVLDRGQGMNDDVIRQALLPFYSTKQSGAGVGLPLCREIVEAHGGSMRIQAREGGGTVVSLWLPPRRSDG